MSESQKTADGNLKFGAVIFDDVKDPTSGWASVTGAQPAKRISGQHELATDTIWWTNLTYDAFKSTKASQNSFLRQESYLVVKPKDVLAEWGKPLDADADYVATLCSYFFHRIMTATYRLAKECNPKLRMNTFFVGNTLREDVRALLPKAEYPKGEAALLMQKGQAFDIFTQTRVRPMRGSRAFTLRRPRLGYAMEMLQTPVPKGPFEYLQLSDLRKLSSNRVDLIRNIDRPCLAEVVVQQIEEEIATIYAFGSTTDKTKKIMRSWVAHPEFRVMSCFSDVEVRSAWMGSEYQLLSTELPEPMKKFLSSRYTELSWSGGIIAETIWRASTLGEEKSWKNQDIPYEERPQTSWRGAWINSADRTSMFLLANKLYELGHGVTSYGSGWIRVHVLEDQITNLINDGLTLGLVPNMSDIPDGMFPLKRRVPWNGDKVYGLVAQLYMMKASNQIINFDRMIVLEDERRNEVLAKLIPSIEAEYLASKKK